MAHDWWVIPAMCAAQVEPFLLPPVGAGANEVARRAALLERRTTWLCNSLPEEDMPAELRLESIR